LRIEQRRDYLANGFFVVYDQDFFSFHGPLRDMSFLSIVHAKSRLTRVVKGEC
jgi:hypothetical protein